MYRGKTLEELQTFIKEGEFFLLDKEDLSQDQIIESERNKLLKKLREAKKARRKERNN